MKPFARLVSQLDQTRKTNDKVEILAEYFSSAHGKDAAWALYFLLGNKLRLRIPTRRLRIWAAQLSQYPEWLVDDCYERVGDLAETAALLVPSAPDNSCEEPLHQVVHERLLPLQYWDDTFQLNLLQDFWQSLNSHEAFVVNKMITGGFRIGVSRSLIIRALAKSGQIHSSIIAHRLMGDFKPTAAAYQEIFAPVGSSPADRSKPYPFFLASPLADSPEKLGNPADWVAEWKWDGIRGQLIKREGVVYLWSRGDESVTNSFPEIVQSAGDLPDGTVLDGEIVGWSGGKPAPFHVLQTRLNRKDPTTTVQRETPVKFIAFDCLEFKGKDHREFSLHDRLEVLGTCLSDCCPFIQQAPKIEFRDWHHLAELRETSRDRQVEGLMLKNINSPYRVGRVRGDWWKWKVDPYTIDLVMVYAQAGHGRRSGLFTDYTLAAWNEGQLVPVAKAYSGLDQKQIRELDRWIKSHTLAKRGPVRTVPAHHVFEIAFEAIRPSPRHKSGIALRFPRIQRWRKDKTPEEADQVQTLKELL